MNISLPPPGLEKLGSIMAEAQGFSSSNISADLSSAFFPKDEPFSWIRSLQARNRLATGETLTGSSDNLNWSNPQQLLDKAESVTEQMNNMAIEQAQIDREFQQSSAREAMEFNAEQADLNRAFQQSSAREAMKFSAAEAEKTRNWQETMSNTAYQRAVADLTAAGLNPALIYSQGGAATTSGATASGYTSSGSSASGISASGSRAQLNLTSVTDMIQSLASNAKDERVASLYAIGNLLSNLTRLASVG